MRRRVRPEAGGRHLLGDSDARCDDAGLLHRKLVPPPPDSATVSHVCPQHGCSPGRPRVSGSSVSMAGRSSSPAPGPSARRSSIEARPSCRQGRLPWPKRSRRAVGCSGLLRRTADPARSGALPAAAVPIGARHSTAAASCFPTHSTRAADAAGAPSRVHNLLRANDGELAMRWWRGEGYG